MAIVDAHGKSVAMVERRASDLQNESLSHFALQSISLKKGERYRIRLTSANAVGGDAISWLASAADTYPQGQAIVDGAALGSDFIFRIGFAR